MSNPKMKKIERGKTKTEKKVKEQLSLWEKTQEIIPFIFFGGIILSKIISLVIFLRSPDFSWALNFLDRAQRGGGIDFALYNTLGRLTYNIFAILFDALIITSYIIRSKPAGKAEGFWERYYPLITVLFPMLGFTYILFSRLEIGHFLIYFDLPLLFPYMIISTGLIISFIGVTLSIITLWYLKRCFSIMVEVRNLVTTGMYRHIRHPLYMSEIIHALGTTILFLHPVSVAIFIITLILEIIRAKFEEHKFLKLIPAYADYKKRTGFLWPKFW